MLTRPARQSEALAGRIRALGAKSLVWPLLVIEPLAPGEAGRLKGELQSRFNGAVEFYAWIFVSANAVREFWRLFTDLTEPSSALPPCFAIGDATALALADHGIQAHTPGEDMNSETLLAMAEMKHTAGKRVLLCRGEGGRTFLADTLRRRGAEVVELPLYRRRCPVYADGAMVAAMSRERVNTVVVASGETLENFVRLLGESAVGTIAAGLHVVVPGSRVAAIARAAGFTRITVASRPTDDGIIDALRVVSRTA